MFSPDHRQRLEETLDEIETAGLRKNERILTSSQSSGISVASRESEVLNMCANNYLGLANHPELINAAKEALDRWGFGMASVRFICGTQSLHKELEASISSFLGTDDTILYSSCFDANGGLFETILGPEDAVISDSLNHASIIDGIRLCKARRFRYANRDLNELEERLREAREGGARSVLIATDGVFSMDGHLADLPGICDLAEKYEALVMVDDSHATGFVGEHGGGTPELHGVSNRIDILTSTLGKALGGASGGFTSGRKPIIDLLRQRSRPYLFSNSLAPSIAAATMAALKLARSPEGAALRETLRSNTKLFRKLMTDSGFEIVPGDHPITPVMLGDAKMAGKMAELLLEEGIYAIAFSFPVVPEGKARIRTQISAAHTPDQLKLAHRVFVNARSRMN